MSINELYEKIDELNKKISKEERNKRKRRRNIKHQIEELKNDRTRFGLKKDFFAVDNINSQIKDLEIEINRDYASGFKRQIKSYQNQIVGIIGNYYKKDNTIEDIIKIENIPQNIYDQWFKLSDFGEKSGYLFVECVNEEDCNWLYSNPINKVRFDSIFLDELIEKANEHHEILFVFDNNLAEKSNKRDLTICQGIIDNNLDDISNYRYLRKGPFRNLRNLAGKFSENQIKRICDFFIEDLYICDFQYDIIPILKANEDKFSPDFYTNLIDKHISKLKNSYSFFLNEEKIFSDFEILADKFTVNEINRLSDLFVEDYSNSRYLDIFEYILEVNKDKIDKNRQDIYNKNIENSLNRLSDSDLNNSSVSNLLKNLKYYSKNISKEQLDQLCDIVINNCEISGSFDEFDSILSKNQYDFDYGGFINNRIQFLKNIDFMNYNINDIMFDLRIIKNHFDKIQLNELCNIIVRKTNLYNFGLSFNEILEHNEDKLDKDMNKIYSDIIVGRIEKLKQYSFDSMNPLLNVLDSYSRKFTKNELELFCNIIRDNDLIRYLVDYLSILRNNLRRFGDEYDNQIYGLIIDCKLDELYRLSFGYPKAKEILGYLTDYYDNFTEEQLVKLCNIAINNSQVYRCFICTDNLRYILDNNKNLINPVLYDQVALKNGF